MKERFSIIPLIASCKLALFRKLIQHTFAFWVINLSRFFLFFTRSENVMEILKDLRLMHLGYRIMYFANQLTEKSETMKIKQSHKQSSLEINTLFGAFMQKAFTEELVS